MNSTRPRPSSTAGGPRDDRYRTTDVPSPAGPSGWASGDRIPRTRPRPCLVHGITASHRSWRWSLPTASPGCAWSRPTCAAGAAAIPSVRWRGMPVPRRHLAAVLDHLGIGRTARRRALHGGFVGRARRPPPRPGVRACSSWTAGSRWPVPEGLTSARNEVISSCSVRSPSAWPCASRTSRPTSTSGDGTRRSPRLVAGVRGLPGLHLVGEAPELRRHELRGDVRDTVDLNTGTRSSTPRQLRHPASPHVSRAGCSTRRPASTRSRLADHAGVAAPSRRAPCRTSTTTRSPCPRPGPGSWRKR